LIRIRKRDCTSVYKASRVWLLFHILHIYFIYTFYTCV
jgi:zona occludens toxin (predicted ATPase)